VPPAPPRAIRPARIEALARAGQRVHTLPVSDPVALDQLRRWTGQHLVYGATDTASGCGSEPLTDAVAAARLVKDQDELSELREAAQVTRRAHLRAFALARTAHASRTSPPRCWPPSTRPATSTRIPHRHRPRRDLHCPPTTTPCSPGSFS